MKCILHVDGGARGNPGPAAGGVVLRDDAGRSLLEAGYLLGIMTNNQAEYSALLLGLQAALRWGADELTIYSDSELMVKQLLGQYRVTSADLKILYADAQRLLLKLRTWMIQHVGRENNRRADQLVNHALDVDDDVVEVQVGQNFPRLSRAAQPHPVADVDRSNGLGKLRVICVEVTGPPQTGQCPRNCAVGDKFVFNDSVPEGLCLDGTLAVLAEVIRLKNAMPPLQKKQPGAAHRCGRTGCGAVFKVSISEPSESTGHAGNARSAKSNVD